MSKKIDSVDDDNDSDDSGSSSSDNSETGGAKKDANADGDGSKDVATGENLTSPCSNMMRMNVLSSNFGSGANSPAAISDEE